MKFGVFSVCLPEYGIAETVKILADIGYDAVEWRVAEIPQEEKKDVPYEARYWGNNKSTLDVDNIESDARMAKELSDAAGLEIFGLTTYLPTNALDKLERVFKAARAIGAPQVRVGMTHYDPAKAEKRYPELFAQLRGDLKKICDLARETGVKAVLEIHMDTLISSASAAYRALEGFDPNCVGLIYDPGNMVYEGFEDYQKSFELLGNYIAHVHMKNGRLIEDGRDENGALKFKRSWVPLTEGMADLAKVFHVMKVSGYDGSVSIEDFSNELNTVDKLTADLAYLKKLKALEK